MAISEPPPFRFTPRPSHVVGLTIAQVLLVVGGALAGYGFGCTAIDGYDDAPPTYVADGDIGAMALGGLVVAVVGWVMWSFMADSHPLSVGQLHSWATFLPAAALGVLAAARELGVAGGYVVVAAGLAAAGAVAMVVAAVGLRRRRRRYRHELDLITRGAAVTATVLDSGIDLDDFEEASNVITTVTFRFFIGDHAYRVPRRMTVPRHGILLDGQRTTVWYDPDDPLNDRAMVIAIQHALRWNVPVPDVVVRPPAVPS